MTALPDTVEKALAAAGLAPPYVGRRLSGGMNNQMYDVNAGGRRVVVKVYFHDSEDQRDRLNAEFRFLQTAIRQGVTCVSEPLWRDDTRHIGIYSHIDGRPMAAADVNDACVAQMLAFVLYLNRDRAACAGLPPASESCFSAMSHVLVVEERIARLEQALGDTGLHRDVAQFLAGEVRPLWQDLRRFIVRNLADMDVPLPDDERIVSPSDMGFHNALLRPDGTVVFVDFEYAGWDDPAKMVCDAFHQVEVPIPIHFYAGFRDAVAAQATSPQREAQRYDLLMPLYGIKWCTILLNEFLPAGRRRREFADSDLTQDERRAAQLAAARRKLAQAAALQKTLPIS